MSVCERKAHSLIELKILIALLVVGVGSYKGRQKMNCCQGNITSHLDQKSGNTCFFHNLNNNKLDTLRHYINIMLHELVDCKYHIYSEML